MRKFSSAVQERETKEPQDKINIDPNEIPKASKYSFHDNRFFAEKKVLKNKKMGKKEQKMDQKWEHDKFIPVEKKPLKINIIKKEEIQENIKISITKSNSIGKSSNQVKLQTSIQNSKSKTQSEIPKVPALPQKPINSKANNFQQKHVPERIQTSQLLPQQVHVPIQAPIPLPAEPLQMVPQLMMPQMFPDSNFMYSPYMTNSGQILYMTESGLFVPSPFGYFPAFVPGARSKAVPIVKPVFE